MNIPLGYVQLDGSTRRGTKAGGRARIRWAAEPIFNEASSELFPDGLDAFQKQLGLPPIAHNRWIDDRSPYREKYAISGNVTTDRRLWSRWMRYLRASAFVRTSRTGKIGSPPACRAMGFSHVGILIFGATAGLDDTSCQCRSTASAGNGSCPFSTRSTAWRAAAISGDASGLSSNTGA
jgi:hypothetical protein